MIFVQLMFVLSITSILGITLVASSSQGLKTLALATDTGINADEQSSEISESSDDVSAASGSNRFVVWTDETPGNKDIFFRRSTDNGATWGSKLNLSSNPGSSAFPQIAVSGSIVYVVWYQSDNSETNSDVFIRRSTDNGATWGPKINLSNTGSVSGFPSIAVYNSNAYVVWSDGSPGNNDIFFKRSTNNGATWAGKLNLSSNPGPSEFPQIAVSGSNVYVSWMQSNASSSDPFFRRSTDNGATWGSKLNVGVAGDALAGPDIGAAGSNAYITWLGYDADFNEVVFFKKSTNNGANFGSALELWWDYEDLQNPQLVATGTNVYVTINYHDTATTCGQGNYVALMRSTNSGSTFNSDVTINGYITYGGLAATGANVYFLYSEAEALECAVEGPYETYMLKSTNNGASFGAAKNLSNNGGDSFASQVYAKGTSVYAIWRDDTPGNEEVFFKRSLDSGTTWKPSVNLSANSGDSFDGKIAG